MKVVGNFSYTKLEEIGAAEGRNSRVFRIRDEQMGADLVAKEVDKSRFTDPSNYFSEAQTLYASQHQHILRVQYAGELADHVCLVMPRAPGGSLQAKIRDRSLTISESLHIMQQLLAAVAHVHSKGFLHLDIKPSNILFDQHGRVLLADFGQSSSLNLNGVVATVPALYPPFLPPEVISTAVAVQASDVYQCAFTLLRCLWGDWFLPPHPKNPIAVMALEAEIANGKFPPRRTPLHAPARLQRAIAKGLNLDPARRFQSATEFAEELARVKIGLDWQVSYHPDRLDWFASRLGHPGVRVIRRGSQRATKFEVEAHLESAGNKRGHKKDLWRKGLTEAQSESQLKKLFKALP